MFEKGPLISASLAVDEVPTRTSDFVVSLSIASKSDLTANLIDALTRGAGECTLSVGSRCPRRKLCGGVNPSNPPLPAMGFAPPALVKVSTRPRSGIAATLRSPDMGSVALDTRGLAPTSAALRPSPRGEGGPLRGG